MHKTHIILIIISLLIILVNTKGNEISKNEILSYNLKRIIDKYNIISFDIFDTLLVRPYVKPRDLFFHLEKLNNATGFTEERVNAEKKLHNYSFIDIYNRINPKFKYLEKKK